MAQELFLAFMTRVIRELKMGKKYRTAETYSTTRNSFQRFLKGQDIYSRKVTSTLIVQYERWLAENGVTRNTSSFYMRVLRAVYNRAVERGLAPPAEPFKQVYTGVDKTRKRAVSVLVIRRMKQLDLHEKQHLIFARDLFLFSFYTRGMSFVDMSYLRPSNIQGGYLSYVRRKTGQTIRIKWEPCMQEIVDRYPPSACGYLLPIIRHPDLNDRSQYRNVLFRVNSGLAEISRMLHVEPPITTYVARHSWASLAYARNVPVSIISEAMGHDSERTTRIYLASVSNSKVDKANSMIIGLL